MPETKVDAKVQAKREWARIRAFCMTRVKIIIVIDERKGQK